MENPYIPFYKPYGMTDEEYEVRLAEQHLAEQQQAKEINEETVDTDNTLKLGDSFTDINSETNEIFKVTNVDNDGVYDENVWYRLSKNCKKTCIFNVKC